MSMLSTHKQHYGRLIGVVLLIAFIGYAVMHLLVYVLPLSQNTTGMNAVFTVIIIALGLSVPYWMLKFGIHQARMHDPREKEMTLKDLPKNQDEQ
jgi:uncharacterized membrane protein YqjE